MSGDAARAVCPECSNEATWASMIGEIVRGVYDGVLIWRGPCGHQWPRFLGDDPRRAAAERIIAERKAGTP